MRKPASLIAVLGALTALLGCASNGVFANGSADGSLTDTEISAMATLGQMDEALSGPLFEGDGGKDIRLAVLEPELRGADPAETTWLPGYVQGFLHDTFRKYSRMTLSDRQNLNRIFAEQELAANGRFSDTDFISMTNLTNAEYILTGNIQKLPGGVFSVSLSITGSASGESRASFMQTGTAEALWDGTLISSAAEDILAQMGVRLTETGRRSLRTGRYMAARAATGFARGLAAQESGAAVEALLNYSQAAAFDPSRIESLARLGSISSEISGGSVSANILGDIQARNAWLDAFRETAAFFNSHPPFEITYDPNLTQIGQTDYARNQADLAMQIRVAPSEASFAALNALIEGLEKTGKRETWGFSGWPLRDIQPQISGTTLFPDTRSFSFAIQTALVNEQRKVIARGNITLKTGKFGFKAGDKSVEAPGSVLDQIIFSKVNVPDLTPTLTVVIAGINRMSGRQISETGYMRIAPGDIGRELEEDRQAEERRQEEQRQLAEQRRQEEQRPEDSQSWIALFTLSGHAGPVATVAFSPDGGRIASGSYDNTVKVWNAETGALIRTLGHTSVVSSVAFSPDGSRIAAGDDTVKVWDVETGILIRTLSSPVATVAFGPDGGRIASGSWDGAVKVWDAGTGALIRTLGPPGWVRALIRLFPGHEDFVDFVTFSPGGDRIAASRSNGAIKIWNAETGALIRTVRDRNKTARSVAFSPDGSRIASGAYGCIVVWNAETGALIRTFSGPNWSSYKYATFNPGGDRIAAGSDDRTVKVWNAETGDLIRTLSGHTGWVESVAFSPGGDRIASGSRDNTVKVWGPSP
jgi:hypothetical protein